MFQNRKNEAEIEMHERNKPKPSVEICLSTEFLYDLYALWMIPNFPAPGNQRSD